MRTSEVLERARHHLEGGWSPTVSRDAAGETCGPDDEGLERVCLLDACLLAAKGNHEAMHGAMRALGHRVELIHHGALGDWEAEPKRTQADVLLLLNHATNRARAEESR
jgi:hypothetical protein